MIKQTLRLFFLISMYELGKYMMNSLITRWQSDDAVDLAPIDFVDGDHADLNTIYKAEVSD